MSVNYHTRLLPVVRHLETHFNEPLNLDKVAALACLSPYHFHRIFKAVMGETLNEYLRRLRLEAIASTLFYQKPSVTAIALEYGFSSSQSLAKAFRQHFGLTPSQVRDCVDLASFAQLLQHSKIGHTLRKNGHASDIEAPYTTDEPLTRSIIMDTMSLAPGHLAYIRVTGPYGENYQPACEKLFGWAGPRGLAGNTCIFVYHDNPEITAAEKCRTDICLVLDEPVETAQGIELKSFDGGEYAFIRKTITNHSQYAPAWDELMGQLVKSGLDSDDRPCFELYHSCDDNTNVCDVSFCTAIKA